MQTFIKQLFCKCVNQRFIRNLYGDQIVDYGWKRSLWYCVACDKVHAKKELKPT